MTQILIVSITIFYIFYALGVRYRTVNLLQIDPQLQSYIWVLWAIFFPRVHNFLFSYHEKESEFLELYLYFYPREKVDSKIGGNIFFYPRVKILKKIPSWNISENSKWEFFSR